MTFTYPGRFKLQQIAGGSFTTAAASNAEELRDAIERTLGDVSFEYIDDHGRVIVDGKPVLRVEQAGSVRKVAGSTDKPLPRVKIDKSPLKKPTHLKAFGRSARLFKAKKRRKS